jgi:hypothetical protein
MAMHCRSILRYGARSALAGAAIAVVAASPASAGLRQANFQTPDGNVSCNLVWNGTRGSVQCWVASVKCYNREIGMRVPYAWRLPPFRGSVPARFCPGDYVSPDSVLRYGATIRRGGVTCKSLRTALRCVRGDHGFLLGHAHQRAW